MSAPKQIKETNFLKGREALKDTVERGTFTRRLGKTEQKPGLLTNPRSKHFNSTIAKNRAKEKNRRHVNQRSR